MTLHHSGRLADAVTAIEREINQIWAPAPGAPPKTRASTANLVIISGQTHLGAASTLADSLATAEVARTIVVGVDPKLPPWGVDAQVSERCRAGGSEGDVCSERIDLVLGAAVMSRAASVISSLCVTEVPTSIIAVHPVPSALLTSLMKLADRLVVDSDATGIDSSATLARDGRAHLVDLAWDRLTPWRHHLAACFDDLRTRRSVTAIRRVTLRTSPTEGGEVAPSVRWILGWLSARLGWRFTSANSAIDALNQPVILETEWRRSDLPPGLLVELELQADATDVPLLLSLSRPASAEKSGHAERWALRSIREGEETGVEDHTHRILVPSIAALIDRAIHDPIADSVLRQTLTRAALYPPPAPKRTHLDDPSQPQPG